MLSIVLLLLLLFLHLSSAANLLSLLTEFEPINLVETRDYTKETCD